MKAKIYYKISMYLVNVSIVGIIANLLGAWRAWFWTFVAAFVLSYVLWAMAQYYEEKAKE
jgi:hypothetical protein